MERPNDPHWPWEKRFPTTFSPFERCDFCHKKFGAAPYIYRNSYVGASENTEVDLACKECIEKPTRHL